MALAGSNHRCTLDRESKARACKELNEKVHDREGAVIALRSWVDQQPWLRTPTDSTFLLRFLRVRKYSQLAARETLVNYWTNRSKCPAWFGDLDPADPLMQKILRKGCYFASLKRSRDGRRIAIAHDGGMDCSEMKEWGVDNVFRAKMLVNEWLTRDEFVQVNGLEAFTDFTGMTLHHNMMLHNLENSKRMLNFFQNSMPCRIKHLYMYNEPHFIDALVALMTPFTKEKILARAHFYGRNLSKIYRTIDMSVLPDEYLPDDYTGPSAGAVDDIIEAMIEDMMRPEFRNHVKELSSAKYGVDLTRKPQNDTPVGSFRKLNVD